MAWRPSSETLQLLDLPFEFRSLFREQVPRVFALGTAGGDQPGEVLDALRLWRVLAGHGCEA